MVVGSTPTAATTGEGPGARVPGAPPRARREKYVYKTGGFTPPGLFLCPRSGRRGGPFVSGGYQVIYTALTMPSMGSTSNWGQGDMSWYWICCPSATVARLSEEQGAIPTLVTSM